VVADVLLEMTPEGEVLRRHRFADLLDPTMIGYFSLSTNFWVTIYDDVTPPPYDWAHANGVHCDGDDRALVSFYNLSAVAALDLESGEIEWLLSDPEGWREPWSGKLLRAVGDLEWPYYPHAVTRTQRGTLLLFANGVFRARPFRPPVPAAEAWSRAVELAVDQEARTVTQVWSYGGPGSERFLSPFLSEADELPRTGNILITDGGRVRGPDGSDLDAPRGGHHWARVIEVTRADPPEKVWEIRLDNPDSGWAVYRSERLPSLYPAEW
jgi:arylsulfate sulfotransferase